MHTPICDLLNIAHPLLQGGMAHIAGGALAGAVSEAGGLGIIGAGGATPSWLLSQIRIARQVTEKPIGVNLMLMDKSLEELTDIVIREGIEVVTTGAGNPGRLVARLKEAGIRVIPVVSSVALAKRLERLEVDAFIAEGMESGGHVGEMSTMTLVPMIVDAVSVPVIAAGGIADGRGMAAALMLGAQGVQMGTRFLCSTECLAHPDYKERVVRARDRETVVCGQRTGHPVRAIHNRFTREYRDLEFSGTDKERLLEYGVGRYPRAALEGDVGAGSVLAGEVCGLIREILPAGEIVASVMRQAEELLKKGAEI